MTGNKLLDREKGPVAATGCRVFQQEGGSVIVVGPNIEYEPAPGDVKLNYVRDITVQYLLGDVVKANIVFLTNQAAIHQAIPSYFYTNPLTGKVVPVKSVEFADGTFWHNPEFEDTQAAKGAQEIIDKFKEVQAAQAAAQEGGRENGG